MSGRGVAGESGDEVVGWAVGVVGVWGAILLVRI